MEIRTYKRQNVTPQPINKVLEPDFSRENAMKAWADVIGNDIPRAAMAVDEAYQKEQDFKFGLIKDKLNEAGQNVLDGVQQKYEQTDPVKLYFSDDSEVDYLTDMENAKAEATKNLSGGLKRRADRYWEALTSANAAVAKDLYDKQKKMAGAVIAGRQQSKAMETAVNATDGEAYNAALKGIEDAIDESIRLGAIPPAGREQAIDEAKKQVQLGRAMNILPRLSYKDGQKFILRLMEQGELDNDSIKALKSYHKDYWDMQTNLLEQEQGEAFNEWIDAISKGTATREGIMQDSRFDIHPELGLRSDLRKSLITYLDKESKANAPSRSGTQKAETQQEERADTHMGEFYDFVLNPYATKSERVRQFAEFIATYPAAAKDLSKFNTLIDRADDLLTDPGIKALQADVDSKIAEYRKKGKTDEVQNLLAASRSLFQTLAEDMWYKMENGQRKETSEIERQKILSDAKQQVAMIMKGEDIIASLGGFSVSGNPPKFKLDGEGYRMDIDGQYDEIKEVLSLARNYQYTDEGRRLIAQLETTERQAVQNATGESLADYTLVIENGKAAYLSSDRKTIYNIDRNDRGVWNIYKARSTDQGWEVETITPQIIRREKELKNRPTPPAKENIITKGVRGSLDVTQDIGAPIVEGLKNTRQFILDKTRGVR